MSKKKQKQPEPPAIELPEPETAEELVARLARQQQETEQAVPEETTMARIRHVLITMDLIDGVDAALAAMPEGTDEERKQKRIMLEWWNHGTVARRDNQMLLGMASALGLTSDQIDDIFRATAQLDI